jgi:hypothetical protein
VSIPFERFDRPEEEGIVVWGLTSDSQSGVGCPLNYVKTKIALGGLSAGQVVAVLLDEKARNVPEVFDRPW